MRVELLAVTQDAENIIRTGTRCCQSGKQLGDIQAENDFKAVDRAVESGHMSVVEHVNFTFWIEGISRACSHQLVRYRHASFSQQSQRHIDPTKGADWYVVPPTLSEGAEKLFHQHMLNCAEVYAELVSLGAPKEDARFVLSNACKTRMQATLNLAELIHIANQRLCVHAQWEIRDLVREMCRLAGAYVPRFKHKLVAGCRWCDERAKCGGVR